MPSQTQVGRLAGQTMDVVNRAIGSLTGPLDDIGPFMITAGGDSSKARLFDLPDESVMGDAGRKAKTVHELVRPAIAGTGATLLAWVTTVFTLDLVGKSEAEAHEAMARVMRSGIADHPDRRESLIVNAIDAESVETWIARVVRSADAPPTLGPWQDFDDVSGELPGLEARSFYGEASLLGPLHGALKRAARGAVNR
jgi:hypothetical protein